MKPSDILHRQTSYAQDVFNKTRGGTSCATEANCIQVPQYCVSGHFYNKVDCEWSLLENATLVAKTFTVEAGITLYINGIAYTESTGFTFYSGAQNGSTILVRSDSALRYTCIQICAAPEPISSAAEPVSEAVFSTLGIAILGFLVSFLCLCACNRKPVESKPRFVPVGARIGILVLILGIIGTVTTAAMHFESEDGRDEVRALFFGQ